MNKMIEHITYSSATETDTPYLTHLLAQLFSIEKDFEPNATKQEQGLALLLKNQQTASIQVARDASGNVIGMVSVQLVISTAQGSASAWIEDMVIDASFRGQGIGKHLLQRTLAWAKDHGATRAQLLVDTENAGALAYYEHLGWESTQLQARKIFL
ncbi:MAG: GNAT family N-acetyltransferase [Pseudomonadota bacterium]